MITPILFYVGIALYGPDYDHVQKDVYVLVDTKSKDYDIARRSKQVKEIFIEHPTHFPAETYYIKNFWKVHILELENNQYASYNSIPAFRFSKNGQWESFAPGTFAASGTFKLSLYSILRWTEFSELVYEFNELSLHHYAKASEICAPIIPRTWPVNANEFYHWDKTYNKAVYFFNPQLNTQFLQKYQHKLGNYDGSFEIR